MNRARTGWWTPATGFFVVLWIGLLAAGRTRMLRDPGTLWHTTAGERMLETGVVIRTDPFSFSQAGQAWIAQQWLGECAMAITYRVAGLDGLVLGAVTLLAGLFAFLGRRFFLGGRGAPNARGTSATEEGGAARPAVGPVPQWPAVGLLLLLVAGAGSYHFIPRPHLVTLALMAWITALLCDVEGGRVSARRLLLLPPVFVLWTNLHGGALGGVATAFVVVMGWLLRPARGGRIGTDRRRVASPILLGAALSLSFTAVLVNPYGPALPRVWLSLMGSDLLPRIIIEHAPLDPTRPEGVMVLLLAAVYFRVLVSARRAGLRVAWFVPMIWLVMALSRVRHGPLFAVTAAVAIADMLPHATMPDWFPRRGSPLFARDRRAPGHGWRPAAIPAGLVAAALLLQATGTPCPLIGAGWCRLDASYWPVAATAALRRHLAAAPGERRVFNELRYGGYLIRHAPEARVYIDDRCELYRDAGLKRYLALRRDPALLEGLSAYEDVRLAMVRTDSRLARYLDDSPRWSALHRDATASLYRRK